VFQTKDLHRPSCKQNCFTPRRVQCQRQEVNVQLLYVHWIICHIFPLTAAAASARRSATTTCAPSYMHRTSEQCSQITAGTRSKHDIALTLANNSAMPRPIPAAPPVTTATLPANTPHTTIKWCTYFTARRYTGIEIHLAVSWLTSVLRLPPQCKGQTVLDSSERMDAMFADRA